jgi:hypothetical protein
LSSNGARIKTLIGAEAPCASLRPETPELAAPKLPVRNLSHVEKAA